MKCFALKKVELKNKALELTEKILCSSLIKELLIASSLKRTEMYLVLVTGDYQEKKDVFFYQSNLTTFNL